MPTLKSLSSFKNEHNEDIDILSDDMGIIYIRSADTGNKEISLFNPEHNVFSAEELLEISKRVLSVTAPHKYVIVEREHYNALEEDSKWLGHLEDAGVDNWEGYSIAGEMHEAEENEDA